MVEVESDFVSEEVFQILHSNIVVSILKKTYSFVQGLLRQMQSMDG